MRTLLFITLLSFLQFSYAETVRGILMEYEEFSEWYNSEEFHSEITNIPSDKYPLNIQAQALLGDGVVFRILYSLRPNNNFKYQYIYGVNEEKFKTENKKYTKLGFTLIHHQMAQSMSQSHQAVWVKNDL